MWQALAAQVVDGAARALRVLQEQALAATLQHTAQVVQVVQVVQRCQVTPTSHGLLLALA